MQQIWPIFFKSPISQLHVNIYRLKKKENYTINTFLRKKNKNNQLIVFNLCGCNISYISCILFI